MSPYYRLKKSCVCFESCDFQTICFLFQAIQRDNPARQALAKVNVIVEDINDNIPVFEYDSYNITVVENLPPGFNVIQVFAHDRDMGDNAKFKYHLEDESRAFSVDESNGWIKVHDPSKLDRETKDLLIMKVTAKEVLPNVNPNVPESFTQVQIHLLDANDNNPQFIPEPAYNFIVTETDPPGSTLGFVKAIDPDIGVNGVIHYSKQDDYLSKSAPFGVHAVNGSIYVLDKFSKIHLKPAQYTFFVLATDSADIGYERRSSVAVIRVNVTDVNNNIPEFEGAPYEAFVGESLPPGAFVSQVLARDPDVETVLTYFIVAGNEEEKFTIDPERGRVTTAGVLDYEEKQSYNLLVQVSDGQNMAVSPLTVKVVDINDMQPVFTHNYYNFSVFEELQEDISVGTVLAVDGDAGKNAEVHYNIIGNKARTAFHIDLRGNILTKRSLDRETETKFEFLLIAFDKGQPQLSGTATVLVRVDDINDNPPFFDRESYTVLVPEEKEPPYKVFEMNASDKDEGENAVIKYTIVRGNDHHVFEMDEDTGVLFTTRKLDYEEQPQYTLHLIARNPRIFQGPKVSTIANPVVTLIVKVQDINDGAVVFNQPSYHYGILETTPRGETVGFVNATNFSRTPQEQNVIYWVRKGRKDEKFWVNPTSGALVLMDSLDRDPPGNQTHFSLEVFARDTLSVNAFNTSVEVKIEVIDVNDNAPKFNEERYSLELPEILSPGSQLPLFYEVQDIDSGINGKIEKYFTDKLQDTFVVNHTSGTVKLISSLDYETRDQYNFTIFAVDGGNPQRTGSATVVIQVQNINEFSPEFIGTPYNFWTEENSIAGTGIGQIKAFDKDGDNVSYNLTDGDTEFFRIEDDTGRVFVKSDLVSRTQYSFTARATDDGVPRTNSLDVKVDVFIRESNDYAPVFTQEVYKGFVTEKVAMDEPIVEVSAIDRDLQNSTRSRTV
ncbi:protocadherin Fat 4-like [Tachypleus tridentatus]|uniref:protocadherin Fat 4-like n=1 Tax=Tachypleus tridentatus TaxID=6853 RepID=UPI003FD65512